MYLVETNRSKMINMIIMITMVMIMRDMIMLDIVMVKKKEQKKIQILMMKEQIQQMETQMVVKNINNIIAKKSNRGEKKFKKAM